MNSHLYQIAKREAASINITVDGFIFTVEPREGLFKGLFCLWSQKNKRRIRHESFLTRAQVQDKNCINKLIKYAIKKMPSTLIKLGYEEPARNYTEILTAESTADAYNNCQCYDEWYSFQVFIIEEEQVIGITSTWPISVTKERGDLHSFKSDPRTWEPVAEGVSDEYREPKRLTLLINAIQIAIEEAKTRGWKLADWAQ